MDEQSIRPAGFGPRGSRWVLTYCIDLPVNHWDAWMAITARDGLAPWFPATIVGEWTPGRRLAFTFPDDPDADDASGEVIDVDSGRLLAFSWGADSLRMTLQEHDAGTRLVFAASLGRQDRGVREGAGWHCCLARLCASVGGYVADGDTDPESLLALYAGLLGPGAAASPNDAGRPADPTRR